MVPALAFRSILVDKLKVSVAFNLDFKESVNFCWVNKPMATQPEFKLTSTVVNVYKESFAWTYTIMPCFLLFTGIAFLVVKSGRVIKPPLPKLSICVGYTEVASCVTILDKSLIWAFNLEWMNAIIIIKIIFCFILNYWKVMPSIGVPYLSLEIYTLYCWTWPCAFFM